MAMNPKAPQGDKTRKRLFGGEVTVSNTKRYDADGAGYTRGKSKVVTNKSGDIIKTVSKKSTYSPTGVESGKLSESKKTGTTKVVKKYSAGSTTPKSVKKTGMKK
jgi:hypothetical protein